MNLLLRNILSLSKDIRKQYIDHLVLLVLNSRRIYILLGWPIIYARDCIIFSRIYFYVIRIIITIFNGFIFSNFYALIATINISSDFFGLYDSLLIIIMITMNKQ